MDFVQECAQKVENASLLEDVEKEEKYYQDRMKPRQNRQWFFIFNFHFFKIYCND